MLFFTYIHLPWKSTKWNLQEGTYSYITDVSSFWCTSFTVGRGSPVVHFFVAAMATGPLDLDSEDILAANPLQQHGKYHEISWYCCKKDILYSYMMLYVYIYIYIHLKIPHYDTQKNEYYWQRQIPKGKAFSILFHIQSCMFMLEGQTKLVSTCINYIYILYNHRTVKLFFPPSVSKIYVRFFLRVQLKHCTLIITWYLMLTHVLPGCLTRQDGKLDLEKEITAAEETVQVGAKNPYSLSNISDPGNIIYNSLIISIDPWNYGLLRI